MTSPAPKVWRMRDPACPTDAVYVGRAWRDVPASKFGNPFHVGQRRSNFEPSDAPRMRAIEQFREWLLSKPELVEAAKAELRGKHLVCWCAPLACHADVLLEIANS